MSKAKKPFFTQALMQWHATHHRPLPWKGEKNPWLIWLSEIILQQTRVEQGLPYFEKFKEKYPTVMDLANAPEDEVMKMWEGPGYYSRARNMHAAAKYIAGELGGIFPKTYDGIRALEGVGDYTAAAIASFAYDLPHAVVDGNVYRVLSRYSGLEEPIDTTAGKKLFARLAQALLDESQPGSYNQAIMDFGASQCTPAAPECGACPFVNHCEAKEKDLVNRLPVKSKRMERRRRFFNYLVLNRGDHVFIKKRTGKDIWRNLYDFPLIETPHLPEAKDVIFKNEKWREWLIGQHWQLRCVSPPFVQELTHQKITALFWEIELAGSFDPSQQHWMEVKRDAFCIFAFPRIINRYLSEKFYL
jgi:A/G-specific adenine glycosylase